jgi:hypothetical protein
MPVRQLQRRYLQPWVDILAELAPDAPRGTLRTAAHATFRQLNSTRHHTAQARSTGARWPGCGTAWRSQRSTRAQLTGAGTGAHGSW